MLENTPKQIPIKNSKSYPSFALETDEGLYLCSGQETKQIQSVTESSNFIYYILDFAQTAGPGIIRVNGEPKYAHVLARKQLEEQGDLTPDDMLWIYKQYKVNKTESDLLYHIFPKDIYNRLQAQQNSHAPGLVCFDSVGILVSWVQKAVSKQETAIIMRMMNSLLLVVSRKNKIEIVRRYSQFESSAFGSGQSFEMLEQDLDDYEKNQGRSLQKIIWLETWQKNHHPEEPQFNYELETVPVSTLYTEENETIYTCLPWILKEASPKHAFLGKEESILRPLEKKEKYFWAVLLLLFLTSFSGYQGLKTVNKKIEKDVNVLNKHINSYEQALDSFNYKQLGKDYEHVLKIAQEINMAGLSPPFASFWSKLEKQRPQNLKLKHLQLEYENPKVKLKLQGFLSVGMVQGQKTFTAFVQKLQQQGFSITDQKLNLELNRSTFSLDLEYRYS